MIKKLYTTILNYKNRQYTGNISNCFNNNYIINKEIYEKNIKTQNRIDINRSIKNEKIIFHTYWYGEIGRKQAFSIKSFLVTQNVDNTELWLWLDEESGFNNYKNNKYLKHLLPHIKVKKYNPSTSLYGSPFENSISIFDQKKRLAYRGDGLRMWALNKFGGLWFDLDVMFLKDFQSLLSGHEFAYAWEYQPYANNAILYIRKNSYINNHLERKILKNKTTRPWILFNYDDKNLRNLMIYPCFLFDPLWQDIVDKVEDKDKPFNDFKDFFKEFNTEFKKKENINSYKDFFKESFAYHWHNNWDANEYQNSYFGLFENEFNKLLGID